MPNYTENYENICYVLNVNFVKRITGKIIAKQSGLQILM